MKGSRAISVVVAPCRLLHNPFLPMLRAITYL